MATSFQPNGNSEALLTPDTARCTAKTTTTYTTKEA